MLKTYEEDYFPPMRKYLKKHDLHCERKSKGVFKFVPNISYSDDYKFIVHVGDSYTTPTDPICINVQAHASRMAKNTSFWAGKEQIEFIYSMYNFFLLYLNQIRKEEDLCWKEEN